MNPYSGLVDLFEKQELLVKDGNRLAYTTHDGEIIKQFRRAWETNEAGCLDQVMKDFSSLPIRAYPHNCATKAYTDAKHVSVG